MPAYVGHFVDLPKSLFIACAQDFLSVLEAIDMVGQPDETSVRQIRSPTVMRLGARNLDGAISFHARSNPIVQAGKELMQLLEQPGTGPTGDILRNYGEQCPECGNSHRPGKCKVFLEPSDAPPVDWYVDPKHPTQIFLAAGDGPHDVLKSAIRVEGTEDIDLFAVFPFRRQGDRFVKDADEPMCEGGNEELMEAILTSGLSLRQLVLPDE